MKTKHGVLSTRKNVQYKTDNVAKDEVVQDTNGIKPSLEIGVYFDYDHNNSVKEEIESNPTKINQSSL